MHENECYFPSKVIPENISPVEIRLKLDDSQQNQPNPNHPLKDNRERVHEWLFIDICIMFNCAIIIFTINLATGKHFGKLYFYISMYYVTCLIGI